MFVVVSFFLLGFPTEVENFSMKMNEVYDLPKHIITMNISSSEILMTRNQSYENHHPTKSRT